jgi:hypothetical protein
LAIKAILTPFLDKPVQRNHHETLLVYLEKLGKSQCATNALLKFAAKNLDFATKYLVFAAKYLVFAAHFNS